MTLNSLIQTSRPTVSELLDNLRNKAYFVDDSFQRRLVWTERQKVRLVQTVLMGFPMPEVYLWQQAADPETGKQRHSIVDGQQRLTTLLQYTANEWPLSKKHLDELPDLDQYVDRYWKDLEDAEKQAFWHYVINVRIIPASFAHQDVVDVFRRLNETDKSLNPQEMRNAEFNGEFINAAESVTELEGFKAFRLFTESQIRRMSDIEYASGLLIFLRKGLIEENTKALNETYDLYNDEYPEASDDVETIRAFLARCQTEYLYAEPAMQFFSKPVHLFSMFVVERLLMARGGVPGDFGNRLEEFAAAYQAGADTGHFATYRDGASSRTRSRASRNKRINALLAEVTK